MLQIDQQTCRKCGLCVDVCPNNILKINDHLEIIKGREKLCMNCLHCMAICPTESISINGYSYDKDFFALNNKKDYLNLIKSRRAIRNFIDKDVPIELLEQVVEAISYSPPSFPPVKIQLTVVNNRELIKKALPYMITLYDSLLKAMKNPIARMIIRMKEGKNRYKLIRDHVEPLMNSRLPDLKKGTEDTISRNAPAMIIFHADKGEENIKEDIYIALTIGMLSAHSLGLGTCPIDLIPPAIERVNELRSMFDIPVNNKIVGTLILGYSKFDYLRGIKRRIKKVSWL